MVYMESYKLASETASQKKVNWILVLKDNFYCIQRRGVSFVPLWAACDSQSSQPTSLD